MASRRKRGPVVFRPRLSAGLALSLFVVALFIRLTAGKVLIVNIIGLFQATRNVCFGWQSKADVCLAQIRRVASLIEV